MEFKEQMDQFNLKLNNKINFMINKLKNYTGLSLGEQISYPVILLGLVLILTSIVMFII
jgi:hypothetical protein